MLRTMFAVTGICVGLYACGKPPTQPTSVPATRTLISYTINMPDARLVLLLNAQHPDGVYLAPITAQATYNYSTVYGGTPNVYAGEQSPALNTYFHTGIVVAPRTAASKAVFTGTDWPNLYGDRPTDEFAWVGRFAYAQFIQRVP